MQSLETVAETLVDEFQVIPYKNGTRVWYYLPDKLKNVKSAPVVVYLHGMILLAPDIYEAHDALLCISAGAYVSQDERPKSHSNCYFKSAD